MYLEFFGLRDFPFRLTPDSEFLFMSDAHARAKSYMDYSVWNREGFVVITGEVGCGKTTLIQKLLSELDDENVVVAKIFQTQLDEVEFLQSVLVEFGLNPFNAKKVELIDMLNTFLIEQFMQVKQLVLIVDDAHNLSTTVLEEIRMLSGLETRKEKILHVILVGQPPLNDLLELPELEQLLQRVRLRYHIKPLTESETAEYVYHRIRIAGGNGESLITKDAIPTIHNYTGGIPRLINTFCDMALTIAYADGVTSLGQEVMKTTVEELQWVPYAKRTARNRGRAGGRSHSGRQPADQVLGRSLERIVSHLNSLEEVKPTLGAISASLAAIERHLARIVERDGSTNIAPLRPRKRGS